MKPATEKLILSPTSKVTKEFKNALMCAHFDETQNKIYPCRHMKPGRKSACIDNTLLVLAVLKAQGYKTEQGDGGGGLITGNYIKVSKTALAFLKGFRSW